MGITMALIKAYGTVKDASYKLWAEKILRAYSLHLVHENLTQDVGLAGMGELYLEAYRVFGNTEWRDRADWLTQFLIHTRKVGSNNSCHWINNNALFPTADLMVGNSGIIHFLIRSLLPRKMGYRVLE